jgi:hypothetical protein
MFVVFNYNLPSQPTPYDLKLIPWGTRIILIYTTYRVLHLLCIWLGTTESNLDKFYTDEPTTRHIDKASISH